MSKVELEAKVDALMDEINFLKMFFEAVRNAPYSRPRDMVTGTAPGLGSSDLSGFQWLLHCNYTLRFPVLLVALTLY